MKNDEGVRILDAVRRMRRFHADVAELLRECESQLLAAGWRPVQASDNPRAEKSGVTWSVSKSLDDPEHWLPQFANRAYMSSTAPTYLVFVNVIWDLVDYPSALREPVVTAGVINYAPHNVQWSRIGESPLMHVFLPGWTDTGDFVHTEAAAWGQLPKHVRGKLQASTAETMAVPLLQVTDRPTLIARVVEPLLHVIPQLPQAQ